MSEQKSHTKQLNIKILILQFFSNIPEGECVWIGASTWGTGQYKWIELPPNYGDSNANGELLSNTYNNFAGISSFKIFDVSLHSPFKFNLSPFCVHL